MAGRVGIRAVPDHCEECGESLRSLSSGTLVYLAPIPWGYLWQRSQQLMSRLAGILRVLYVQPEPLKNFSVLELSRAWRRAMLHFGRGSDQPPPPGLKVIAPPLVPLAGSPLIDRLNSALMARTITRCLQGRKAPFSSLILWCTRPTPVAQRLAQAGHHARLIYEMLDAIPATHPMASRMTEIERALIGQADFVLCTSEPLLEHARRLRPDSHLIPNGVDPGHFLDGPPKRGRPPLPLDAVGAPIVGCHGTIGEWIDLSLVSFLADRFPEVQFVMVGPVEVPRSILPRRRNLHWMGPRPYQELPAYVSSFAVGLLPLGVDEYTRARNPVKLFEYFATGKPVVSTDLPEVAAFGGLVYVGRDPEGVASALQAALAERDGSDLSAQRRAIAEANTWDHRVRLILHLLHSYASEVP